MILFHRSAAASWGHVASIIKKSPTGDSLSFGSTTNNCLHQVHCSNPWRHTYFGNFHHRDPRATNARAELKGTGHTQLSFSRHFICKPPTPPTLSTFTFTNLIEPTLSTFTFNLYQTHFTHLYLQPYNIHNKPNHILHLELFLELSFVNSSNSLFIPFGVKPCLLLLLYINFVARISSSSSFLQKLSPKSLLLAEYGLFFYKT